MCNRVFVRRPESNLKNSRPIIIFEENRLFRTLYIATLSAELRKKTTNRQCVLNIAYSSVAKLSTPRRQRAVAERLFDNKKWGQCQTAQDITACRVQCARDFCQREFF